MIYIKVSWELYRRSSDRSVVALDSIGPRRAWRGYVNSSQDRSDLGDSLSGRLRNSRGVELG